MKKKLYNRKTANSAMHEQGIATIIKLDTINENGNHKHKKNRSIVVAVKPNSFYSDAEYISKILENESVRLNVKPVVSIDPNTINIKESSLTESEKAFMLARKYKHEDPTYTLKSIWQNHRSKKMNARTISIVNEMVKEIRATKKV